MKKGNCFSQLFMKGEEEKVKKNKKHVGSILIRTCYEVIKNNRYEQLDTHGLNMD